MPEQPGVMKDFMEPGNEEAVEKVKQEAGLWYQKDIKVLTMIVDAVPSSRLFIVKDCNTAKEAWEVIKKEFRPANCIRVQALKNFISQHRFDHGMDIMAWRAKMRESYSQLMDLDPEAMKDEEFACHIISILPTEGQWHFLAEVLTRYQQDCDKDGKRPSSLKVMEKIREEHFRQNKYAESEKTVMAAQVGNQVGRKCAGSNEVTINHSSSSTKRIQTNNNGHQPRSKLFCVNENHE